MRASDNFSIGSAGAPRGGVGGSGIKAEADDARLAVDPLIFDARPTLLCAKY